MSYDVKDKTIFDFTDDLELINKILGTSCKSILEAKEEYESNDIIPSLGIYPPYHIYALAVELKNDELKQSILDVYGELPKDVFEGKVGFE